MASSQGSPFLLSAADVSWGRSSADIDGGTGLFYVWFDLDAGSTDPAVAGRTGIEVDVTTGQDAAAVASALQAVLEANANFRSELDAADSNNETVIMEAEFKGAVVNDAADADTGFVITQQRDGLGGDLGRTNGGVEVTMATNSVQIFTDQTGGDGGIVNDEVILGNTIEASFTLIEMTQARWELVVGSVTGSTFTPSGGTEVVGFGEDRLYQSLFDLGGELVLHPTRNDASDRSQDITFFKSAPKPETINFSPDEVQGMAVTFSALPDRDLDSSINIMVFGDSQQDFRN